MASSKKWFLGFVIVALAASAAGQDSKRDGWVTTLTSDITTITDCDARFRFRNHEMRIGDLFPEDCSKNDGHRPIFSPSYSWHGFHVLEPVSGDRPPSVTAPLDVPAIAEKYLAHHRGDSCESVMSGACIYTSDEYEDRPTCADKSRILLTAQNGDKWCHKPQTGVTK